MSAAIVRLEYLKEPNLVFGRAHTLPSAKDGLFLFGPLAEELTRKEIRYGVVGTTNGIKLFRAWVSGVRGFIAAKESSSSQHRPFPGFASVFGVELPSVPVCELAVSDSSIDDALFIADRHVAIHRTVELFAAQIQRFINQEELSVDLWFVVIPEHVHTWGRPKSSPPVELRQKSDVLVDAKMAKSLSKTASLFAEDNAAVEPYLYEVHFRNQLKARLLQGPTRAVAQIVRETTVAPEAFLRKDGLPIRRLQDPATVAWNLCTTAYFKAIGRPWKLARVRDGVCYVGLVFKKLVEATQEGFACCGAQMFLDSGDGLVFRGAVGPWHSTETGQYHLSRDKAKELMGMVVTAYSEKHGNAPKELFVHAKNAFDDDEWAGFLDAVPGDTHIIGVRIKDSNGLKLYRPGENPVLRGTSYLQSSRGGFLWSRGYVPYLATYPGRETPNPLRIDLMRGDADLRIVVEDVLNLTKLNFNACIYGDGRPVTLRFAEAVGEILTAGPVLSSQPPLPFKHYI
jgi:hypothetical protein